MTLKLDPLHSNFSSDLFSLAFSTSHYNFKQQLQHAEPPKKRKNTATTSMAKRNKKKKKGRSGEERMRRPFPGSRLYGTEHRSKILFNHAYLPTCLSASLYVTRQTGGLAYLARPPCEVWRVHTYTPCPRAKSRRVPSGVEITTSVYCVSLTEIRV